MIFMATPVTEIELKYLTIFSAERGMKLQAESIFLVFLLASNLNRR